MTFISVTVCCRQLGIDAKTLHRWLAQAEVPLQAHASDGRLKGLSGEQLLQLATAHHRRLAVFPEEGPAPVLSPPPPPLPEEWLALLAQLAQVPAQLAALQEQMGALTQRMIPAAVPCPHPLLAPEPTAPPGGPRAPKPPPKPTHVVARVEYVREGHYVVICPTHGLLPFEAQSPQWFAWLATRCSFRFVGKLGHFTAHREVERVPNGAWRAHRKVRNHTHNLHLGPTESLTMAVLEQAAAQLQAHLA